MGRVWDGPWPHRRVEGSGLGELPRILRPYLAHLPTFLKLGLCQGLMHQTEIRIDLV